jgi:hypothetical protein
MPFKSTEELYSAVVLPKLREGPKTLDQLKAPRYALKKLEAHGLVAAQMYRVDSLAVEVWFLKEDLELLREAGMDRPLLGRRHCWELTDEDFESVAVEG